MCDEAFLPTSLSALCVKLCGLCGKLTAEDTEKTAKFTEFEWLLKY